MTKNSGKTQKIAKGHEIPIPKRDDVFKLKLPLKFEV
jgi:hypothetical protein